MNQTERLELAERIRQLDALSDNDKAALLALLHERKKYGIVWEEKTEKAEERLATELPVLIEDKERFIPGATADAPNHILIEGDNLYALTALSYTHVGMIDVIYIDPPYNTGNKDFMYNDRYIDADDPYRHSTWLSFMNKRLKLAKRLLSQNGSIFISIDDHEQAQLRLLCDEVFGEHNFVTTLHVEMSATQGMKVRAAKKGTIVKNGEYILIYSFNPSKSIARNVLYDLRPEYDNHYSIYIDDDMVMRDLKEIFKSQYPQNDIKEKLSYMYRHDIDFEHFVHANVDRIFADDKIEGYQVADYPIIRKAYLVNGTDRTYWIYNNGSKIRQLLCLRDSFGETDDFISCVGLRKIRGDWWKDFYKDMGNVSKEGDTLYPNGKKPVRLIYQILKMVSWPSATILDFFAGSGTTLHAVAKLNNDDGGKRICILAQSQEKDKRICETTTYPRCQNVINGYGNTDGLTDNTLRYYRTDFVGRERTPRNMRRLMSLATDMLCIKNNLYCEQDEFCGRRHNKQKMRYFTAQPIINSQFSIINYTAMLVVYDELDHSVDGYIHPGEVLFTNWESINKDTNLMVRDSEQQSSLYDICRRTKEQGLPIIVVVDEAHAFYGGETRVQKAVATKSQKVLERIQPKLEILVSATIQNTFDGQLVQVERQDVIREQMIKRGIVLNPDIDVDAAAGSLTELLVDRAVARRELLAEAYRTLDVNINPLLLIQLPNDSSDRMDSDDQTIAEDVKQILDVKHGINTQNGLLAVWLSGVRVNVDDIERQDSMVQALLFKQAIALGWDCPRAAVLLIFRKMESYQFTMQTVGRILRMPEQRHYADEQLNRGYVYTDLSRDRISIVTDDMAYIYKLCSRRREGLVNVSLPSAYSIYRSQDRARLLPDFRKTLYSQMDRWLLGRDSHAEEQTLLPSLFDDEEEAADVMADTIKNRQTAEAHHLKFDVQGVVIEIPEDVYIDTLDEPREIVIDMQHRRRYAQSHGELIRLLEAKCHSLLAGYEKHSLQTLTTYMMEYLEKRFEVFETEALKIVLYHSNWPRIETALKDALRAYMIKVVERQREASNRSYEQCEWEVPAERIYNSEHNTAVPEVEAHVLLPFVRFNGASKPERDFERFLEANREYIDWWYKNGDSGKEHYAVPYINKDGARALFYPDFVIRMRNGQVLLFDTKTQRSDIEAPAKHNALIEYMNREANAHLHLRGGVLLPDGDLWRYCPMTIFDTNDLTGWNTFLPQDYGRSQQ